jgi:hypothetical protein
MSLRPGAPSSSDPRLAKVIAEAARIRNAAIERLTRRNRETGGVGVSVGERASSTSNSGRNIERRDAMFVPPVVEIRNTNFPVASSSNFVRGSGGRGGSDRRQGSPVPEGLEVPPEHMGGRVSDPLPERHTQEQPPEVVVPPAPQPVVPVGVIDTPPDDDVTDGNDEVSMPSVPNPAGMSVVSPTEPPPISTVNRTVKLAVPKIVVPRGRTSASVSTDFHIGNVRSIHSMQIEGVVDPDTGLVPFSGADFDLEVNGRRVRRVHFSHDPINHANALLKTFTAMILPEVRNGNNRVTCKFTLEKSDLFFDHSVTISRLTLLYSESVGQPSATQSDETARSGDQSSSGGNVEPGPSSSSDDNPTTHITIANRDLDIDTRYLYVVGGIVAGLLVLYGAARYKSASDIRAIQASVFNSIRKRYG